jgi:GGDEF domain-containing protein
LFVANKIGRDIAEKNRAAAVIPGVTVSIGVAAFPTCAYNVHSLFNAADEALEQARKLGRGQVVLAPASPNAEPAPRAQKHVHSI